jgi:glycosyltransferase involved in cell wall biosynthesis
MKILHIHPDPKMASKFIYPLLGQEKLLGHQTKLIVFIANLNYSYDEHIDLRINNYRLILEIFKFIKFIKNYNPDIIFCHNSTQSTIPILISRFFNKNKIIYFNHGITYLGYSGLYKFLFYLIEIINNFFSDQTITVSEDMRQNLSKIKPNVKIINNGSACGIDLRNLNYPKFQKDKNKTTILFVGRCKSRKGLYILINIFSYFEKHENVNFLICGFEEDEFFRFSKRKFKNLKCLGFINNIDEIYQVSDILLLPSLHEGLSYSILEAMKNRTLVFANDIPGIRNLITDNYNGVLIKNNDANNFIATINDYLINKVKYKKYLANAVSSIKKYDRKEFLKGYGIYISNLKK